MQAGLCVFCFFLQEAPYKNRNVGTTYIRWGRTICPGNGSEATYDGFAGGSHYDHNGGASSMLCLPREPKFEKYDDTVNGGGFVFGTSYRERARSTQLFLENTYQHDVPCVVCQVRRATQIMIPGRSICYPGWTLEYWGYLMSGGYNQASGNDYYCIDAHPQNANEGAAYYKGNFLYFVESRCVPLKCPPYIEGRELTCVVCTQ